jgi:hypothetical protein
VGLVYDQTSQFGVPGDDQQVAHKNLHPADHAPGRALRDVNGLPVVLLNPVEASPHLFVRDWIAQLPAQHGDTLGVLCAGGSNGGHLFAFRFLGAFPGKRPPGLCAPLW